MNGTRASQLGQALILVIVLLGAGVAAFVYNFVTPARFAIESDRRTAAALAQARDALIGFAAGDTSGSYRPGDLPCPNRAAMSDGTPSGIATGSCNSVGLRIGRLPWKTLGLPELRDGAGEPLWYAVSNNFKHNTRVGTLNSNTPGEFSVTGSTSANNVIAIVFAPGAVVGAQDRRPLVTAPCPTTGTTVARNLCAANYLEGGNEDGDTAFLTGPATAAFNDRLLLITADMLFPVVEARVVMQARAKLRDFFSVNGFFPFANAYNDASYSCTPNQHQGRIPRYLTASCKKNPADPEWVGTNWETWFFGNNWHEVLFYAVSPRCVEPLAPGCTAAGDLLTVDTMPAPNDNIQALILTPGQPAAGQARPCGAIADCLEHPENTDGDTVFTQPAVTSAAADRVRLVSP